MNLPEDQNTDDANAATDDGIDLSDIATDESAEAEAEAPEIIEQLAAEDEEATDPVEEALSTEDEINKWKEIAARSQADLDNYRKRMARDRMEAIQYGNGNLLSTLLPVIDNFEMGLQAAENEDPNSMIYQGMAMVKKQLDDFLDENHVETIEITEGADFDPNLHEAIKQEPSDTVEEGKIIYAMRRGYKLKDRLLRPANVVVSQGEAAPEEEEAADAEADA